MGHRDIGTKGKERDDWRKRNSGRGSEERGRERRGGERERRGASKPQKASIG